VASRTIPRLIAVAGFALFGVVSPCVAEVVDSRIGGFLSAYCYDCHNPQDTKGKLDLKSLASGELFDAPKDWQKVSDAILFEEMPPDDHAAQPKLHEREQTVKWIDEVLAAGKPIDHASFNVGPSIPRRLNRDEFANTLFDLTGVELEIETLLPEENIMNFGFDTIAEDLDFTGAHLENYMLVSDLAIEKMFSADPEVITPEIVAKRSKFFATVPNALVSKERALRENVHRFASHAFRRYLSAVELDVYTELGRRELENGATYVQALKSCVKAVLLSPQFLYRVEDVQPDTPVEPITQLELASRLSYFIWSSMPDSDLLQLSSKNKLNEPAVLRAQLRRMLEDPKAKRFAERFVNQWLFFELEDIIPDQEQFPDYDSAVHESAKEELVVFFQELFRNGRTLRDLIDADYIYVNERLADFYGVGEVKGDNFQLVQVDDFRRGGMLGMTAILTRTSMAQRTSPTKRGKWVLDALFGTPPPPPPEAVEPIDEASNTDAEGRILTFREKLEQHSIPGTACAGCHKKMDPYGFAMENFNAVGRWRTSEGPQEVDASATLPNGREIVGLQELKDHLKEREDDIYRNFAEKLMIYALGRGLTPDEYLEISKIVDDLEPAGYPADELLFQLVSSFTFQHKKGFAGAKLAQN